MTPTKRYQDLPSVMQSLLKKYDLTEAVKSEQIINDWDSLVGEHISKQCKPVEFRDGELIIKAKNSIWREELAQRQMDLLNLLNGRIKSSLVKKIKII
jgi:predicted nucleic acid-binding Zn ribbon protein